jgi:hypothetical protein
MSDTPREVVRVGSCGARIVRVGRQRIDYVDAAGQERFVDLEGCASRWGQYHGSHRREFLPLPGASGRLAEVLDLHGDKLHGAPPIPGSLTLASGP